MDMPRKEHSHHDHGKSGHAIPPPRPGTAVDPVCGMTVEIASAKHTRSFGGSTWYFCSKGCADKFAAEPERYAKAEKPASAQTARGATYTCPMHPEIRQQGPGSCPKCGMALEPEMVSLEEAPNVELIDMTRRFWIAAALSLPVFAFAMTDMIVPGAS